MRSTLLERRGRLESYSSEAAPALHGGRIAALITEVDAALDRLDGPGFGACTKCDGFVEKDLLEADPMSTVCLECMSATERSALERDLELASRVQATLLPPRDLDLGPWCGHYTYRPHGTVSGDYVDVIAPDDPEGDVLVLLGDVSGKGVAAALLMSQLHAVFRVTAASGIPLVDIVERANGMLHSATTVNVYATLAAVRLATDGTVEICNAGHVPPLLLRGSEVTEVAAEGFPLGLFAGAEYSSRTFELERGDGLLLYTDGLTESSGSEDEELGVDGLRSVLSSCPFDRPDALVQRAVQAAERHRQGGPAHDDLTIMALARR